MSATNMIKQRLQDLNMTQTELSGHVGITRQNLGNKLARDNFTTKELEQICNILALKLQAVDAEGKRYYIEYQSNGGGLHLCNPNETEKGV